MSSPDFFSPTTPNQHPAAEPPQHSGFQQHTPQAPPTHQQPNPDQNDAGQAQGPDRRGEEPQRGYPQQPGPDPYAPSVQHSTADWAPERTAPAPPPYSAMGEDLLLSRRRAPAQLGGWRGAIARASGGRIEPGPSAKQVHVSELIGQVRAPLVAVHKLAVLCLKGGVGKTTVTTALGIAIARQRGDRVIAVDANPDMGTLSDRFGQYGGPYANIEHLAARKQVEEYFAVRQHTVQNPERLEMLGAQNDPATKYVLNPNDYLTTMRILDRFYNVVLTDCGTSLDTPLFRTIASEMTSLVIVAATTVSGIRGAVTTLQWLSNHGFGPLITRTVVVLNSLEPGKPMIDLERAVDEFKKFPGVKTFELPYDPHLAEGLEIRYDALKKPTKKALLELAGGVAEHYPARQISRHRSG